MALSRAKLLRVGIPSALVLLLIALAVRPKPIAVDTAIVTRGPLRVTVDADGQTRIRHRYEVSAPVTGRVSRIELLEGDSVWPGREVARVTPGPLDARSREQLTAQLQAAQDAERENAARVRTAQTEAGRTKRDATRIQALASAGQVAPRDLEMAEATAQSAVDDLAATTYRQEELAHDVDAIRAELGTTQPARSPIEIRSPIAGVVLRVIEPDDRVVAAGESLLELGNPRDLEIVVDVLTTDAVRVVPGADVLLDGWGGDTVVLARVRRVEPAAFTKVSSLGVEEQRVNIVADVVHAPHTLGDRYKVHARIVVWSDSAATRLPISALFRAGSGWAVYVVNGGRAERRALELGAFASDAAQVLRGPAPGDRVILHPGDDISDGARVKLR